jgi:hypothetical protein
MNVDEIRIAKVARNNARKGKTYSHKVQSKLAQTVGHFVSVAHNSTFIWVVLGGVMVSVLPTGPRFSSSNPAEGDAFLKAIKIRTKTSFTG